MSGTGAKTQPGEIGERGQLVEGDHQSVSEHARAKERDQPQSRGRGASPEHGQPEVEPDHVGAHRPKLPQDRQAGAGAIPSPYSTHVDASNALSVGRSGHLVGEDDHGFDPWIAREMLDQVRPIVGGSGDGGGKGADGADPHFGLSRPSTLTSATSSPAFKASKRTSTSQETYGPASERRCA